MSTPFLKVFVIVQSQARFYKIGSEQLQKGRMKKLTFFHTPFQAI